MSMKRWKDEPSREELLRAFAETPQAFRTRMDATLRRLKTDKEERIMKRKLAFAPVLVLILALVLAGVAVAALYPRTAERFGDMYGEEFGERLTRGDAAELGESHTLGSVTYTVTDVIYADGVLYGTVVMEPAQGENVVLIPEDTDLRDPAGYNIHDGETAPADAKSYAQLAAERGARIVLAKCVPEGYVLGGEVMSGDVGYTDTVTRDGAIISSFELYGWNGGIERADSYTLRLDLGNWEVTPEGEWLREEPQNTWLRKVWDVTVAPELRERTPEPEPPALQSVRAVVPDGFDGTIPVRAVTQRDFRQTVTPEDFTLAKLLETKMYDECIEYQLEGGVCLTVARDRIDLRMDEGTQELTYETEDGTPVVVEAPREAVTEYLYGLAMDEYFKAYEGCAYVEPASADALLLLTLPDAQDELTALLGRLGIENAVPLYALAMDAATAHALSDARNAEVAAGRYPGMNPYDLTGVTERDEGYLLVCRGEVNGVRTDEAFLYVSAYVTVDGVRSLTLSAPFEIDRTEGAAQSLIALEEALARAMCAAQKSWIPELAPSIAIAQSVELIYTVRDKARLVPAWQVNAFDGTEDDRWPVTVIVSALDGEVLSAPWQ